MEEETLLGLATTSSTGGFSLVRGVDLSSDGIDGATLAAGSNSGSLYYYDETAGTPTLTVSGPPDYGWTSGTSVFVVKPNVATGIEFTSENNPSQPGETSDEIVVTTTDDFGNPSVFDGEISVEISTSSDTGGLSSEPEGDFSETTVLLEVPFEGTHVGVFYRDTELGSPTISAKEVPSLGWEPIEQTKTIALTFEVDNLGALSVIEVETDSETTITSFVSRSQDDRVALSFTQSTTALSPEGTRLETMDVAVAVDRPLESDEQEFVGEPLDLQPDGATFDPPLMLTISYEDPEFGDTHPDDLDIHKWDGTTWIPLNGVVDEESMTVSVEISHFSSYALVAREPAGTPTIALVGAGIGGLGVFVLGMALSMRRNYRLVFRGRPRGRVDLWFRLTAVTAASWLSIAFIALVGLKMIGFTDVSWIWIASPLWGGVGLALGSFLLIDAPHRAFLRVFSAKA